MTEPTHHFVTVGQRRVHYTRSGTGPAVLLLHESPCSAKSMRLTQTVFAAAFTAIAFDTPGFGLSDSLDLLQPEIADYADALALTLDALGITQAAAYGRHTGASIAVEFARRHPRRCSMVLTGGYPIYSMTQRNSRLADYLKPLVPSWDGSHLVWLWFRYREQHVFWPWHDQVAEHRATADVPDLDYLHRGVVELLEAGDDYRVAYAAAFRHRGLDALSDLTVPACFGAQPSDSLFRTLTQFPPGTWTQEMPLDDHACAVAERALLARHPAPAPPPAPTPLPVPGCTLLDYVPCRDGQVLMRSSGPVAGTTDPLLLLPALPGSAEPLDALVLALGTARPAFALDLPGLGDAEAEPGAIAGIDGWSEAVMEVLDALALPRVHIYAHEGGGAVAVAFARRWPGRVASLVLDSPPVLPSADRADLAGSYAPDIVPAWDGSHLLRCYHHLRDQELWWPWFDRRQQAARIGEPDIDPAALTRRARAMLKQPHGYRTAWQAVLGYDWQANLASLPLPATILATERDIFARFAPAAAALQPSPVVAVATMDQRVAAILAAVGA